MASIMRPNSKTSKFGANRQTNEPAKKIAIIVKKLFLRLNDSKIQAEIGIINPTTNKYAVVNH